MNRQYIATKLQNQLVVKMEEQTKELSLEEKFKSHIHFEEGMDDSLLSFYLNMAKIMSKQQLVANKNILF